MKRSACQSAAAILQVGSRALPGIVTHHSRQIHSHSENQTVNGKFERSSQVLWKPGTPHRHFICPAKTPMQAHPPLVSNMTDRPEHGPLLPVRKRHFTCKRLIAIWKTNLQI